MQSLDCIGFLCENFLILITKTCQLICFRCVKIVAFAGTGKTTTLIELCKTNPNIRFLLVVFNKVVAQLSAKSFPSKKNCHFSQKLKSRQWVSEYRTPEQPKHLNNRLLVLRYSGDLKSGLVWILNG